MNRGLQPEYIQSVSNYKLLWFEPSNQYIIIANGLFNFIATYFKSGSKSHCIQEYISQFQVSETQAPAIFEDIHQLLSDLNIPKSVEDNNDFFPIPHFKNSITKHYQILDKNFQIDFETEVLCNYIHPQLAHFKTLNTTPTAFHFSVFEDDQAIKLNCNKQLNKTFPKGAYNALQGKLAMELICALHNKQEHDWIGTFHASTVSDTKKAVMIIGKSGSGKSTLTTLLTQNDFDLIADDVTPILKANKQAYYNPSGISVKSGSFSTLKAFVTDFDKLPKNHLYSYKGAIKYIPCKTPEVLHLPCNTMVLVHYQPEASTTIVPLDFKDALEILIPDSWISPQPENAQAFIDWISSVKFLKLTYSNNNEAIAVFSDLFKD